MVSLTRENGPVVVAHRGASGHRPENTFASFDLAVKMGADMIELDVHPSGDGDLVVMHDDTVDRTTGGHGRICTMSTSELRRLNAASKSSWDAFEPVPTFAEVLERYPRQIPLMVEVKHGSSVYPRVESKVVEELKRHDALDLVELISFDLECLRNIRRESGSVKTGFIFIGNMAAFADAFGSQFDALHGLWNFVTKAHVDRVRGLGYPAYVWTANSEEEIGESLRTGADGVVSNYPDRVLKALGRPSKPS